MLQDTQARALGLVHAHAHVRKVGSHSPACTTAQLYGWLAPKQRGMEENIVHGAGEGQKASELRVAELRPSLTPEPKSVELGQGRIWPLVWSYFRVSARV